MGAHVVWSVRVSGRHEPIRRDAIIALPFGEDAARRTALSLPDEISKELKEEGAELDA